MAISSITKLLRRESGKQKKLRSKSSHEEPADVLGHAITKHNKNHDDAKELLASILEFIKGRERRSPPGSLDELHNKFRELRRNTNLAMQLWMMASIRERIARYKGRVESMKTNLIVRASLLLRTSAKRNHYTKDDDSNFLYLENSTTKLLLGIYACYPATNRQYTPLLFTSAEVTEGTPTDSEPGTAMNTPESTTSILQAEKKLYSEGIVSIKPKFDRGEKIARV
ncbi:hypothetical protein BDQ12DRAFT_669795 [Crucibulum laeve]|uniref:Uncharacterized protein n=1 Tax=Crucibulum laeve TaxID=68775 RepID=A0A5C3LYW5_9AGAR|nr:hypothetical protein BDQ12DRAFT_669795 [Crucibulum laeve]